jgi:thiamine-phosphate pyrophosphorylase
MDPNVAEWCRLMLVTDDRLIEGRDIVAQARAAERGGITAIQLRLKSATPRELVALVRDLVAELSIPVLVNDRPDVALAAAAAGVHLGPDDLAVSLARKIAPPGFVIGASVGSDDEAALAGDADYWGIGPWRESRTKSDAGAGLGVEGFTRLRRLSSGRPCVAIGSVLPADVRLVRSAGGTGVAVASGILGAGDVESAARSYRVVADG